MNNWMRLSSSHFKFVRMLVTLAVVGLLFGCGEDAAQTESASKVASAAPAKAKAPRANQAPDFALTSLEGDPIRLSDFEGHVVLVDFWATWCGPCRRTIPDLVALYNDHNAGGFDILGIALERQGLERLGPYVQQSNIPYPVLIGNPQVVRDYGNIRSIPTAFLIGRDGTVRQKFVGVQPRSVLEKAILELLAEPAPA